MSISADQWLALTAVADSFGVTRTDLIRRAIAAVIEGDVGPDHEMYTKLHEELVATRDRLATTNHELVKARQRLAAVRAALAPSEPGVAA